jgi:hypothetical protein
MKRFAFVDKVTALLGKAATKAVHSAADMSRLHAGRALVGHQPRTMTPQEWIRWHVGGNAIAFARPPKRGAAVRVSAYGAAQRWRSVERNRKGPNYEKKLRKRMLLSVARLSERVFGARVRLNHFDLLNCDRETKT